MRCHWVLYLMIMVVLGCGSGSSAPEGAADTTSTATAGSAYTIKVVGAASETATCTVMGALGAEVGGGVPSTVSYVIGSEAAAIVSCGSLAALFGVGDTSVTLSSLSTSVAALFAGLSMGPGTVVLASTVSDLLAADAQSDVSTAKRVSVYKDLGSNNNIVAEALVAVADALSTLSNPTDITLVKSAIIKLLINSGEPVVIENIGANKTISACSDAAVATYSSAAVAVNASTIGLTGCLVYHSLDAVTDLNNPLGVSANNIPSAFRTVARETGVIQKLVDNVQNGKTFSMSSVNNYLFTLLGYTVYSQDDEGVTTSGTISTSNMTGILAAFLNVAGKDTTGVETTITNSTDMRTFRFHEGYNPSGGWEINAAATLQTLPAECYDSDNTTACAVQPLKYNFDGTTLTENASGSYILEMQYENGSFKNKAYVINISTGKPYRDSFYQPVQVTINPTSYSAIDYANPLYQSALDPMNDGLGNSAPFSDADWRAKYPSMSNVANSYLFPAPEVAARQIAVLQQNTNLTTIPSLQAYTISKLMTRGMAAFRAGSLYEIFVDHGKTLSNWESISSTWLASGTPVASVSTVAGETFRIQSGAFTFRSTINCVDGSGSTVACIVKANNLKFNQTGQAVTGGTKFTVSSGNLSISSAPLGTGTITYTPTYLLVAPDGLSAQLIGDIRLYFYFTHTSNIATLITNGTRLDATYSLTFYHK